MYFYSGWDNRYQWQPTRVQATGLNPWSYQKYWLWHSYFESHGKFSNMRVPKSVNNVASHKSIFSKSWPIYAYLIMIACLLVWFQHFFLCSPCFLVIGPFCPVIQLSLLSCQQGISKSVWAWALKFAINGHFFYLICTFLFGYKTFGGHL